MLRSLTRMSVHCCAFRLSRQFALAQTEFSADMVDLQKSGTPTTAKILFRQGQNAHRIEAKAGAWRGVGHCEFRHADLHRPDAPAAHVYGDAGAGTGQRHAPHIQLFQTGDVENACGDWQKIARNQGGSCHKVGNETVNGRNTVKYESTNSKRGVRLFLARSQAALSGEVAGKGEQRRRTATTSRKDRSRPACSRLRRAIPRWTWAA